MIDLSPEAIAKSNAAQNDPAYIASREAILGELAEAWRPRSASRPAGLQKVSINELIAVALAIGRDNEVEHPLRQFAVLQPWLQEWVIRKWRALGYDKWIGHPAWGDPAG